MPSRNYKKISNEDRMKILNKFNQCMSNTDIATSLELNYSAVSKIIKNYQKTGVLNAKAKGGDNRSKLSQEQKMAIRCWVDENCLITLNEMRLRVIETFNLTVSCSTIDRCLKEFHYTVKQVVTIPKQRNSENTIQKRYEYSQKFRNLEVSRPTEEFIFVDEVGFTVSSRPKRGRSLIGTKAITTVPAVRTRNISVFAAMNRNEMVFYKIQDRPFKSEDFKTSLLELKTKCFEKGLVSPLFFMDNASIHHSNLLTLALAETDISIEYLPPYSPMLNPIECSFSKWKNYVIRGSARNEHELKSLIDGGFGIITSSDCDGFYRKMLYSIIKSERMEEIEE